jgi:short-subunit dehydrogenase
MVWTVLKPLCQREKKRITRNDGPENFEDRWAIVTGADGPMGRGYARELASRAFNVVVVGHDEDTLSELTRELSTDIGVNVKQVLTDISMTCNLDAYRKVLAEHIEFLNV